MQNRDQDNLTKLEGHLIDFERRSVKIRLAVLDYKIERLERWIEQLAAKTGLKLEY